MASSANQGEESRTPSSSQLRYSPSGKQPRIRVSPPSSRCFPQPSPSPDTVALIANGSYYKVPSKWCPDNKVWSRDLYLSRNSLLKKMIHQRILYRTLEPIDYWVTMPIHPPTRLENADPPELKDVSLNEIEGISIAFATGPVESSRYSLTPPFPFEIKFADPLTNLENKLHSAVSPQLRCSLSRKQPRIKESPNFPQPSSSPEILASISNGSYYKVPSKWCPDNKVWSRDLYLSRNSLLKKMIHQRILYRTLEPVFHSDVKDEDELDSVGIKFLGLPIDYWVTMPIHPPTRPEKADPPELQDVSLNEIEGISIAYATGPLECSRYSFNRLAGNGRELDYDGLPFQWVRNTTGTKFLDRDAIVSLDIEHVIGYVECPDCGENECIGYLLPTRIDIVNIQFVSIMEKMSKYGDRVACKFHFSCRCDHGKASPGRPIISNDLNKINWLFLFLGFGIKYCTIDHLKYYCIQRNLPISDWKNKILATVYDDLCLQIYNRRIVRV